MNEKQQEKQMKKQPVSRHYDAMERCQAVLAIWTEKCRPTAVCREMGIQAAVLQQWQDRALEGMMQALEPRTALAKGAVLSPRLQALLQKRQTGLNVLKLEERLSKIQENKTVKKTE